MMSRHPPRSDLIAGALVKRHGTGLILAAAMTAVPMIAGAATGHPDAVGRWVTPGGDIVAFRLCNGQYPPASICGKIVQLNDATDPQRRDSRNPLAAKRLGPILGLEIVRGLAESSPGVWTGGALYNPDDGRTYRGAIRMQGHDSLELRGCAMVVICQSQTWRRARP